MENVAKGLGSIFTVEDFTFYYPNEETPTLKGINLSVNAGDFIVLCGPSGCGKSTFLRQFKTVLAPHGVKNGNIYYKNIPLEKLGQREQSGGIGFVSQSPDNQIVTDKVWHELAFGLESLGVKSNVIRHKVAEMAAFFGIETWFHKSVTELSGGQKQLLNLASVMAMGPEVLILDEPTAQLDPIAASDFLAVLGKINRELGVTVILTEHRLEEAFPLATTVIVMDSGEIICENSALKVAHDLKGKNHSMFLAMPTPMRVWNAVENKLNCPLTVSEGRAWLSEYAKDNKLLEVEKSEHKNPGENIAINCENLWFRYEKNSSDVVRNLNLQVKQGEFMAILGGNGTGKTTTLKLISSLKKAYSGSVTVNGSMAVLPQNPQALFVKKTVIEDLYEVFKDKNIDEEEKRIEEIASLCHLNHLLYRHPYDLSGGEQQRLALAKVLLIKPDILIMDEPTKGFDAQFKEEFAEILGKLLSEKVTILMVSHDIEFCASYAHRCALFFDGNIVSLSKTADFFAGNSFYTTSANRMSRGILDNVITANDLILACSGKAQKPVKMQNEIIATKKEEEKKKLPLYRKITAMVSIIIALYFIVKSILLSDLTTLISQDGLSLAGVLSLKENMLVVILLLIFTISISRKSKPQLIIEAKKDRKLPKRTILASVLILLLIPITLYIGTVYFANQKYYFIALLILLQCMAPFFLIFEGRKPQARELVIIAVLCAIAVCGRAAFFMLPQFKPVIAICIIAGIAFGSETGFLVGAMTMLASNVIFSQGPWTPWQMFAMGIIGFLAGICFKKGLLSRNKLSISIFGAIMAIVVYGGIMNPSFALIYASEINWKIIASYYVSGFPMDLVQGIATFIFLWFGADTMLEKLDRIKVKYGLVE